MTITRGALVLVSLAALGAIDAKPSAAQPYRPWCAEYIGRDGGLTCTFHTYEQCLMTATPGSGAHCVQNPWYLQYGEDGSGPTVRGRPRR
jgi:uncharacterized protein DUF3551